MNMKDQFKQQRKEQIAKIKDLRAQRNELKGKKNTTEAWNKLTSEIEAVQNNINMLSKGLGITVKPPFNPKTKSPAK